MARPGSSAVGPAEDEMTMLGRHISRAWASENSRVPSGSSPMLSRTVIHLAQSTGVVQMPPAAAAESQFHTAAIERSSTVIGP